MSRLKKLLELLDTKKTLEDTLGTIDWNKLIDDDEDVGGSSFKFSGYSGVECTGYAYALKQMFGKRAKMYGFYKSENPTSKIARIADGHDFIVLDDRFILDPWITDVENISKRQVFDLQDTNDEKIIKNLYGDQNKWKRALDLEKNADKTPISIDDYQ